MQRKEKSKGQRQKQDKEGLSMLYHRFLGLFENNLIQAQKRQDIPLTTGVLVLSCYRRAWGNGL